MNAQELLLDLIMVIQKRIRTAAIDLEFGLTVCPQYVEELAQELNNVRAL